VGGIPEVVSDQQWGLLVDHGDVAALAETLLALSDDPGRRTVMGTVGREKVQMFFDLQKNVKQLMESYGIVPSPTLAERAQ
jgi:glycosyltransferase involved in cell wall biosynthesis